MRCRLAGAIATLACLTFRPTPVAAQPVEITPFVGYRFGNDFFELIAGQPIDRDGASTLGAAIDIDLADGLQFEALFTHQAANVVSQSASLRTVSSWGVAVDHWQAGGLQEFAAGHVRPFLTGVLGLTRYAVAADSEVRFTVGAGGGVKLFPEPHLGLRLDSRVFATFVDAGGTALACSPGVCFVALNAHVVWQAEFTAGVVLRFR